MKEINQGLIDMLEEKARRIRIHSLKMTHRAGSGHPGGSLSMADILSVLYFWYMDLKPEDPAWGFRDRLFLSKGHGCPALYACLYELGMIPEKELWKLRQLGGILSGHPDPKIPGVEAQSGSLSHLLSVAKGTAQYLRLKDNLRSRIIVILSDAELRMGPVFEAALSIAKNSLDRMIVFVDDNNFDNDGLTSNYMPIKDVHGLWESMGWRVWTVDRGNDVASLLATLTGIDRNLGTGMPQVVFCNTVKGAGVSFMANENKFHGKPLDREQMEQALRELGENETDIPDPRKVKRIFPREDDLRRTYGETLLELGQQYSNLVTYAPNLEMSTGIGQYGLKFPERHENVGVQEYNAVSSAAGAAREGAIAFVSTFAAFGLRAWEQIRHDVCLPSLPVCFVFSHAGLLTAADGPTAQCLEDIALMRSLPNMAVMVPSSAQQLKEMLHWIAASYDSKTLKTPCYIRMAREKFPRLDRPGPFEFGKAQILREGKDVTIACCGIMTYFSLQAAESLHQKGIEAEILELPTIKPLPVEQIRESVKKTGCLVTAEEHVLRGGLGSAVAEALVTIEPVPVEMVCAKDSEKVNDPFGGTDCFGVTGDADALLVRFGLTDADIAGAAEKVISRVK